MYLVFVQNSTKVRGGGCSFCRVKMTSHVVITLARGKAFAGEQHAHVPLRADLPEPLAGAVEDFVPLHGHLLCLLVRGCAEPIRGCAVAERTEARQEDVREIWGSEQLPFCGKAALCAAIAVQRERNRAMKLPYGALTKPLSLHVRHKKQAMPSTVLDMVRGRRPSRGSRILVLGSTSKIKDRCWLIFQCVGDIQKFPCRAVHNGVAIKRKAWGVPTPLPTDGSVDACRHAHNRP